MKSASFIRPFAFALLALAPLAAQAIDIGLPGQLTRIDASYRCEKSGGGVAFRIPRSASEPARIWQTDKGQELGLEFEVVRFKVARCPGCYSFEARLGNALFTQGWTEMSGPGRIKLHYSIIDPKTKRVEDMGEFPCLAFRK